MKRRALGGLDSFARRAAQPMTRARALKLAGGAFVAASLPGLASPPPVVGSRRLRGRASQSCPACPQGEERCSIPRGVGSIRVCCRSGWVCCKSEDEVRAAIRVKPAASSSPRGSRCLLPAVLLVGPGQDGARMGDDRPVGQLERR
jgi:hypothetical protein